MNEQVTTSPQGNKLKEESPPVIKTALISSIVMPAVLALVGGLVVYFISQILTDKRDHRYLMREVRTRTFGNRWISAYELSKYLLNNRIPESERPWVMENLIEIYTKAKKGSDLRLQKFSLVALGTFKEATIVSTVSDAVFSNKPELMFHGLRILGNMTPGITFSWQKFLSNIHTLKDPGLVQLAIFTLVHHRVAGRSAAFLKLLKHKKRAVAYAASVGLIEFKAPEAVPLLREILNWEISKNMQNQKEQRLRKNWQLNLTRALRRSPWSLFKDQA